MDELTENIKRAKEGDKNAFGAIYNLFYKRIYRYCLLNTRNVDVSLDICQETFLRAWRSLGNFSLEKSYSFQAYLFRIARNLIIDLSRKHKEIVLDESIELESLENLEEQVDIKDEQKKVREALSKLKEEEKQIIILRYFEDFSICEVAIALKIKEGALRVRTHRILKKLKEVLK